VFLISNCKCVQITIINEIVEKYTWVLVSENESLLSWCSAHQTILEKLVRVRWVWVMNKGMRTLIKKIRKKNTNSTRSFSKKIKKIKTRSLKENLNNSIVNIKIRIDWRNFSRNFFQENLEKECWGILYSTISYYTIYSNITQFTHNRDRSIENCNEKYYYLLWESCYIK